MGLRCLPRWLSGRSEAGRATRADLVRLCGIEVLWTLPGSLKSSIKSVLRPDDWDLTDRIKADAIKAHALRQVTDFFEHRVRPLLKGGGAVLPAADVAIIKTNVGERPASVPLIRFAWVQPLLKRWQQVHTMLLDGTPDAGIYKTIWDNVHVAERLTGTWQGRVFWVTDKGFGRSSVVLDDELITRGREVVVLGQFVKRYTNGNASMITRKQHRDAFKDNVGQLHHHGAIRGLNSMSGVEAHVVVGRQMPRVSGAVRATEALHGSVVTVQVDEWEREPIKIAGHVASVMRPPDPDVSRYLDQIATAGQAQATQRARTLRNPVDVFLLGPERDYIDADVADVHVAEWDAMRPTIVDRMLVERGIAVGGKVGQALFQ